MNEERQQQVHQYSMKLAAIGKVDFFFIGV
jgi:hypothetical protein